MAGAKGRSGGARPGSGGARPGAGRPRKLGSVAKIPKPVRVERPDESCFVYVIYEVDEPNVCKIGVAADVASRLSSMQVGTWRILKVAHVIKLPSKSVAHAVECQAHQALSALHFRGEWFRVTPDRASAEIDLASNQLRAVFEAASKFSLV